MKRLVCLLVVVCLCVPLFGCGKISKTKAEDLALSAANLTRTTTPKIESVLDESTDPPTYKVIFYSHSVTQTVIVNAKTGDIISITEEETGR